MRQNSTYSSTVCAVMSQGTIQGPDACRQSPRVSTWAQDAIPDPQRTQVVTENLFQDFLRLFQPRLVFPLKFLVSETSHTSVYLLRVSCYPHSYSCISWVSFRAWMDPTSKKEGHCDIMMSQCPSFFEVGWIHHSTYCTTVRTILSHLHVL